MLIAAANQLGIVIVAAVFLVGGYVLVAGGWYLMVLRPSRRERAEPAPPVAEGVVPSDHA